MRPQLKNKRPKLYELRPTFWLAANAVFTTPLAEWLDISGNKFKFIQPTSGLRPTLENDGTGRIGVRFNSASAQFLESEIKLPAIFEVHALVQKLSNTTDFMGLASFRTTNYLCLYATNSSNLYAAGSNFGLVNGQVGTVTPGLNTRYHVGGGIRVNFSDFVRIGIDRANAGRELDALVYEIAGWNRILSNDERLVVGQHLKTKWS